MNASNGFLQALEPRLLLSHNPGIDGVGVLGDSYADEYQFFPPDRITARNWVEQLDDDSNADFGKFSQVDPPGPRNAGFEFNWAVSGATSTDMINGGQHLGAAAQAAGGEVDLATMFIGGNDFRNVFTILFTQGPGPAQAALVAAVPTIATNIGIAAGTILSPGVVTANPDINLVLTTIPRLSYLPEIRRAVGLFPQIQPFVDAVDQAVLVLNGLIRDIASSNSRMAVADFSGMIDDVFAAKKVTVGNVEVNLTSIENPTNDPTYFALADRIHPGTIAQGLLANLFVDTANDAFGTRLKKLSPHEILENAGLTNNPANVGSFNSGSIFAKAAPISAVRAGDLLGDTSDDEAPLLA